MGVARPPGNSPFRAADITLDLRFTFASTLNVCRASSI
jgi:hypothetical protein